MTMTLEKSVIIKETNKRGRVKATTLESKKGRVRAVILERDSACITQAYGCSSGGDGG